MKYLSLIVLFLGLANNSRSSEDYETVIEPFFKSYCHSCHTGEKPKGDFRTDSATLRPDFSDQAIKAKWREVVNVLNSHEMPPKKSLQPKASEVARIVDWITGGMVKAELAKRESSVVLRRLNRAEYKNTIRDLFGMDYDVSGFPEDPPAGGFDNNGRALTLSPLHLEIYLGAARQIVERAIVEGPKPQKIKWRFTPKVGDADRTRLRLDKDNNPIVNGGNNKQEGDWVVVHHNSWDKQIGARDFRVPHTGNYVIRLHAAGRIPDRQEVVASAQKILESRREHQQKENPKGEKYHKEQYERDLEHFRNDKMYDYGPPRVKLVLQLGPQPQTLAEFDTSRIPESPITHEFKAFFTKETAGVNFEYAYSIPSVLENFWMQSRDNFARPELRVSWFEIEGPLNDSWPPSNHVKLLGNSTPGDTLDAKHARDVLGQFMRKAFRRPVEPSEIQAKMELFEKSRARGDSFTKSMREAFLSVLISPHFLFLVEQPSEIKQEQKKLTDHEIASRLSYFFWSSMPDAELFRAAEAGELTDEKKRRMQVQRMLKDPKCEAFVQNFAGQWLGLRDVGTNPPAADLYPQYDRHLETSMVGESLAFFREILQNDLDIKHFIQSDFVTINERMARHYGFSGVRGDEFRKVQASDSSHRGGIVTQASVLTITSNGTRTSPVKRGTWIMKNLLGIDPGLPVANAGEIAPKVPGIDKATVRKRLEIHRQMEQCARCHSKIDPLGFALENFNAAGEWRDREGFGYKGRIESNDPLIDARSEMIDGTKMDGVDGLRRSMLEREELFLSCLTSKLYTYALGREMGLADNPQIKAAVAHAKKNGNTLRSVLEFITDSGPFLSK
jgi:hypothetical protein